MMKMVPASRRVTEASLEPPSSPRRRAITPAGEAVADCVSITATKVHPRNAPRGRGDARMYQPFVKIWLGGLVVPGHAKHEPQMRNCASGNLEIPGSMLRIAPE